MTTVDLSGIDIPEVIEAVSKSVLGAESSRRVAWAKMYAALARGEQAERQLAIAREDIELLSRFSAFSFGALKAFGLDGVYRDYLKGDLSLVMGYMPQGAMNAGRSSGESWFMRWPGTLAKMSETWLAKFPELPAEILDYIKLVKERKQAEQEWLAHVAEVDNCEIVGSVATRMKHRVERQLANQFGFPDRGTMYAYLFQYKASNE